MFYTMLLMVVQAVKTVLLEILCMINGFTDSVTIDCASVHLVSKGAYKE